MHILFLLQFLLSAMRRENLKREKKGHASLIPIGLTARERTHGFRERLHERGTARERMQILFWGQDERGPQMIRNFFSHFFLIDKLLRSDKSICYFNGYDLLLG